MLYGRDAECAVVGALLAAARESRSGTLVVRGEPGLGKTALLAQARAGAPDMAVLAARGVESESELPFAGLHQLLRPALGLLERLPAPQAGALRGALGLAERGGDDRFLIAAACLTLIAELAEERPVLCLVDDAQWLDAPSADALLFVARRLDAEGVALLFGAREGGDRRFEARGLPDLTLEGLDDDAAAALAGAGRELAPAVRDLLVEQAGGNALALVELPAALTAAQLAGAEPLPAALPLTSGVERLFLDRVRRLPEPAQRLLAVIATDDGARLGPLLRAAAELGAGEDALAPIEQSGLVSVQDGARIELRHPLVRSAVYQSSSSAERRAAHLALARALTDEADADRRAWHLAAAALGPDAAVAAELERTAERARLRSGHAAAAAALERAAELSVVPDSSARRLVAAGRAAWHAGLPERARVLLERADPVTADPLLRAELAHVRGAIEFRCGVPLEACTTLIGAAIDVAPLDARKALELLFDGALAGVDAGDYARVAEAGRIAAALPRGDDTESGFLADLLVSVGSLVEGKTAQEAPLVLDVVARAGDIDEPRWLIWAAAGAATAGEEASEAAILRRATALARASGAVDALQMVLLTVAVNGVIAGRPGVAAEAEEGLRLAREAGLPNAVSIHLAVLAWFAAVKGEEESCRARAADVAAAALPVGAALASSIADWGLALLDLGAGRLDETVARLAALREAPPGVLHPLVVLVSCADLVEACARSGRDDEAAAAFALLDGFARPGAPDWALALAARCRGLLERDEGEYAGALALHTRPFDRARTQLLLGAQLRRQRRRIDAREHLRAALETFEALGAAPWADRARSELRATGETARKRDPSTLERLTPQELQVARFVGEGLSNKEVAAQLFLSPRTVDAHLRRVFTKLGVTSRTQLARMELSSDTPSAEALPAVV